MSNKEIFMNAVAFVNNCGSISIDLDMDCPFSEKSIVETQDTVENFRTGMISGIKNHSQTPFGEIFQWDKCQTQKFQQRGTLYVMDFVTERLAAFI